MKYTGSCHCGKVRFEVETESEIKEVYACNCSICSRRGYLLTFALEDRFKLLSGSGELADYQFGKKQIHHQFCRTCGIESFSHGPNKDGKESYAINVRCFHDFAFESLPVQMFDGKSL